MEAFRQKRSVGDPETHPPGADGPAKPCYEYSMGAETKITITLPTELLADIEAAVAAGDHDSIDEAIQSALEERETERLLRRADRAKLAALIQEGVDSGPGIDADIVFERLLRRYQD